MGSGSNDFHSHKWWKEAVVYQVYPSSFKSTGSGSEPGWGDIKGITSKLDHIKRLGADVLWVSPIYKSPQVDMGYDVADYKQIDPRYGSLEDVDELIKGLKERGMKLMMDFVANHTSDEHAWFKESRASKNSPKRDWYIWQPPRFVDGKRVPPNNWTMLLGEGQSAWTWDEATQEYYLALFTPEQPDLNWRTPAVRDAVFDVLTFWLDRGASGFRMDVINHISKVSGYPDAPVVNPDSPYQPGWPQYANGPHMNEYLKEMHTRVLSKYDTITVGEMPFAKDDGEIINVVGANENELNMIFIFSIVDIDNGPEYRLTQKEWHPPDLRAILDRYQRLMQERNGWNSLFIENHDQPRSISRYADDTDAHRTNSAKLLALMQTTLHGTLYVYQGEELGLRNAPPTWPITEYKDVETLNFWNLMQELHPNDPKKLAEAHACIAAKSRDHARIPVSWSDAPNAGFCPPDAKPWFRVNDDYKQVNAAQQTAHKPASDDSSDASVYQFWQRALAFRKAHKDALVYGDFALLDEEHASVIAYKRTAKGGGEIFVVLLNFSAEEVRFTLPEGVEVAGWERSSLGEGGIKMGVSGEGRLRGWEGLVGRTV